MPGVKGNRRILYTKNIIKESLIELLKDKEIHQVTVTDICKKADVNRGTFYSHYKDAFDLLQSMEDELFNQVIVYLTEIPVEDYTDILLIKVFELIVENKELCEVLFCKQKDSKILDRILYVANKANLDKIINTPGFTDAYLNYLLKYTIGGIVAVVQTWLENDLVESPRELLAIINNINKFSRSTFTQNLK
ncbi:TetR/AcrR family transcriptional regulator [Clostridium intestinale]|jgi:AcrR family transcriptional regulator|uniref:TetR/AcrR family transcriptional regulator n=1 Tax=Clostridium intestinale TaxID=36845 RepID=A0A7D6ZSY8_9CLOT|nr:TetR/AcrR family transcriptional regulator [Clostridium intestinale]QLY78933.1 TetR/AcrR family transcriptional regulator [Clostridium intestinale]